MPSRNASVSTTPTRRRRGSELDAAIRAAVLKLLSRHGPAGVTMEAVAHEARTSKPVLYRRWADARSLVRDTLLVTATAAIPTDDTGSFRGDMLAVLRGWAALFTGPSADALRAAVAAMAYDHELASEFRADVIGWRKKEMATLLERGVVRGDVRADVPVHIARELGQSVLWHRLLVTGDSIDDELVVEIVDDVLVPFVAPTGSDCTARSTKGATSPRKPD